MALICQVCDAEVCCPVCGQDFEPAPDEPRPLTLTRHEQVQAIVAIDVLLAVARRPKLAGLASFRDEIDASIETVELLRAKIREGLK